jgi:predicted transcriptional regulator
MKPAFKGQVELLELDARQIRAISSVACDEVYETLSNKEPRSIREIADEIGKSPASVNEHMAKLVRVGLAVSVGTRKRRSRTEKLYVTRAMTDRLVSEKHTWETIKVYFKRFQGQMRLLIRQHEAAQQAVRRDRSFVAFMSFRMRSVYLSPEHALLVKQKFSELSMLVADLNEADADARAASGHVRVNVSLLMFPTVHESRKVLGEE